MNTVFIKRTGAALLAATLCATGRADNTNWNGGTGDWATEANWSNGVPTTDNNLNALFNNGGTINFGSTAYSITSAGWTNPDELTFTADSADGGLSIGSNLSIARVKNTTEDKRTSIVKFLKGSYTIDSLSVGYFSWDWGRTSPSIGRVTITDSTVTTTGDTGIGIDGGNGAVTVGNGGTLSAASIRVGQSPCMVWDSENNKDSDEIKFAAVGALNIEDGANVAIRTGGTLSVGNGNSATGTVVQAGGTVALAGDAWLAVGDGSGAVGTYEISGGKLTTEANKIMICRIADSTGILTINGGTVDTGTSGIQFNDNIENTDGTLNLNSGTLATHWIQVWNGDKNKQTINCNGGTLKAKGTGDWYGFIRDSATINVKAGGLIVDTDGNNTTIGAALLADGSMGGIIKRGEGTLTIDGGKFTNGIGFIIVEEGELYLPNSALPSADKITVKEGAILNLGWNTNDLKVRSLTLEGDDEDTKGKIINGSAVQASETLPTLYKAVWTGARSEDVNDPANWAVYYKDEDGADVRVSADELPAEGMQVVYEGVLTDTLPDWSGVAGTKVLKLTADVAVDADNITAIDIKTAGWKLDASGRTLTVNNARNLSSAAAATVITSAGVVGEFASVTAGDGEEAEVKAVYADDGMVSVQRPGGLTIIVR